MIENLHGKSSPSPSHGLPNPAEPVQAKSFVMNIGSPHATPFPLVPTTLTNESVPFDDTASQRQQECECKVGCSIGQNIRCVRHDDAAPRASRNVNVIDPYSSIRNGTQTRSLQQNFLTDLRTGHQ